ncbi:hypothetical protein [Halomonas sp. RA08-2]|uniref:hypothetical protein n=1 Tax=Halomonas sp. RA08-2 TaxID=3440842 RepID=UPI003EEF60FE
MKTRRVLFIALITLAVTGCASRASSVAPASVSAAEYSGMSCADTRSELSDARERSNALTRKQNNAATTDAASVFLVLLPLGSVFGGDVSGELAQAKGEVGALERAITINCRKESIALDAS